MDFEIFVGESIGAMFLQTGFTSVETRPSWYASGMHSNNPLHAMIVLKMVKP